MDIARRARFKIRRWRNHQQLHVCMKSRSYKRVTTPMQLWSGACSEEEYPQIQPASVQLPRIFQLRSSLVENIFTLLGILAIPREIQIIHKATSYHICTRRSCLSQARSTGPWPNTTVVQLRIYGPQGIQQVDTAETYMATQLSPHPLMLNMDVQLATRKLQCW